MANIPYQDLPSTTTPLTAESLNRIYKGIIALGLDQDTYNSSTNYAVGDMVIHDFRIWECTTACTGEWDETKWQVVPIIANN